MILLLLLCNALASLFGRDRIAETVRASLCQITASMDAVKNALKTPLFMRIFNGTPGG